MCVHAHNHKIENNKTPHAFILQITYLEFEIRATSNYIETNWIIIFIPRNQTQPTREFKLIIGTDKKHHQDALTQ